MIAQVVGLWALACGIAFGLPLLVIHLSDRAARRRRQRPPTVVDLTNITPADRARRRSRGRN